MAPPPTGPKAEDQDLERWREKTHIDLESDGTKSIPFEVQVPRRKDLKQVKFTAYAFNEDRVKSETTPPASKDIPAELQERTGKAYVIAVGVNRTQSSSSLNLQYAANDARRTSKVLYDKLSGTRQFVDVVTIPLVSDVKSERGEAAATKAHLQTVLDLLAGRPVSDERKHEIPGYQRIEKAQPEDLVILSFSSHGYTDDRGVFHMVLNDIGRNEPQQITAGVQKNSLSSDVLSAWLRPVDAGDLVMIVDACHSAASVQAEGFKPGPMGSRGFGQLAYDKGMRILAASQAKQSAIEEGHGIDDGLLTYALIHEGLERGLAFPSAQKTLTISEWLAYGQQEVPNLFKEGDRSSTATGRGSIQVKGDTSGRRDVYLGGRKTTANRQQPELFDFAKHAAVSYVVAGQ